MPSRSGRDNSSGSCLDLARPLSDLPAPPPAEKRGYSRGCGPSERTGPGKGRVMSAEGLCAVRLHRRTDSGRSVGEDGVVTTPSSPWVGAQAGALLQPSPGPASSAGPWARLAVNEAKETLLGERSPAGI